MKYVSFIFSRKMKIQFFIAALQIASATMNSLVAQGEMKSFQESLILSEEEFLDLARSAEQGDSKAASDLSTYFSVVMLDEPSSLFYSKLAAEHGGEQEKRNFATNQEVLVLDESEIPNLKIRAKGGDASAAESLGNHFWVTKKYKFEALKWFKSAAENGNSLDRSRYLNVQAISRGSRPTHHSGK